MQPVFRKYERPNRVQYYHHSTTLDIKLFTDLLQGFERSYFYAAAFYVFFESTKNVIELN